MQPRLHGDRGWDTLSLSLGPGPYSQLLALQLHSLAALPLSQLAGHPGQGATFHTQQVT